MAPWKQPAAAPGEKVKGQTTDSGSTSMATTSAAPTDVGIRSSKRLRIRAERAGGGKETEVESDSPMQPPKKQKAGKKKQDNASNEGGGAEEAIDGETEGGTEEGTMAFEEATTAVQQLPPPLIKVLGNPDFFAQLFIAEHWVPKVRGCCSFPATIPLPT